MSSTPSRVAIPRGNGQTGHYANPSSPIASTPQRPAGGAVAAAGRATPGGASRAAPPTPSAAALSPMKVSAHPLQRHEHHHAAATTDGSGGTWTSAIFSPVLKFFGSDEEAEEAAAAEGSSLSAAPAGRKVGDQHLAHSPSVGGAGAVPRGGVSGGKPLVQGSSSLTQLASPSATAARLAAAQAAAAAEAAAAAAAAQAQEDDDDYEYEEFNPYLFIKMLPAYHTVAPKHPHIALAKKPKKAPEVNLVLDLDETLVHCSVDPIDDADVTFPVAFNGCNYQVYVRKRPHLDKFFASIAGKFEVTIFTASQQVYAERLLNILDPEGIYIQNRLYRDSCLNVDGNYLKDLNVLGRDLSKTVLVDNSPHAFGYQLDNGIPIESWFDDKADTELLKLSAFVHQLIGKDDVRPVVRDKFKVHKLVEEASRRIPPPAQAPPMH